MSAEAVAMHADLPGKFLEAILTELRVAGLVATQRGPTGGCRLARPAEQITVADVLRATEGPLAHVRGERPELITYPEGDEILAHLWIAGRAAIRVVFEGTSLADLAAGALPAEVQAFIDRPGARLSH